MSWSNRRKTSTAATLMRSSRRFAQPGEMFERLEERVVFYAGPMIADLPAFGILENQYNTVVRMHTNMGNIDFELFDQTAPQTVANFRRYIEEGRLDETFFHRLVPGFVLQGGGFTFHDDAGVAPVETHAPIPNEFSRLNLERTIAMAKLSGDPNSATSQFFINLVDNPALDEQNGGFTVFGHVVQGWSVVQTIAGLQVRDLNSEFVGTAFGEVPTRANFDPNVGATEASLVRVNDIEVIKTWGSARYFRHAAHISEGFRSAQVVERIDLQNMDRNVFNFYQIIVRYENGLRDQVISSGVLRAGERRTFKVADTHFPSYDIVRSNEPYAIEVRSTRAMAASLNHRDVGGTIEESFLNANGVKRSELLHWRIPGGEKGAGIQSFLTYENLSGEAVTMYILVRSEDGTSRLIQRTVEPFRRGGVELHNIGVIPNGRFSIQINALGPIVAGLSQYRPAGTPADGSGGTTMGTFRGGSTHGVLAGAMVPSDGQGFVDLMYTQQTPNLIIVDLQYIRTNNFSEAVQVILTAGERAKRIDLAETFPSLPTNQFFTLRYSVQFDHAPVAAQYVARVAGDEAATPFQTASTPNVGFAGGFTDPTLAAGGGMQETISVFNPFNADAGALFFYDIAFQFSDGVSLLASGTGTPFTLGAHVRRDHVAWNITHIRAKIESDPQFRFYSVQVITGSFPTGPVVAQLTRSYSAWQHASTTAGALDDRQQPTMLSGTNFR